MVGWSSPIIFLQKQVQVPNLVKNDWHLDHSRPINLIQLFYSVVFFEVKAENGIALLSSLVEPADEQNFRGRDFDGGETPDATRDNEVHLFKALLVKVEPFNRVEAACLTMVAAKDEAQILVENASTGLTAFLVEPKFYLALLVQNR